jgi:hypothetical protein
MTKKIAVEFDVDASKVDIFLDMLSALSESPDCPFQSFEPMDDSSEDCEDLYDGGGLAEYIASKEFSAYLHSAIRGES